MAEQTIVTQSVTEDAFFADRQKFWSSFTGFTTVVASIVVVILVLLAYFLT